MGQIRIDALAAVDCGMIGPPAVFFVKDNDRAKVARFDILGIRYSEGEPVFVHSDRQDRIILVPVFIVIEAAPRATQKIGEIDLLLQLPAGGIFGDKIELCRRFLHPRHQDRRLVLPYNHLRNLPRTNRRRLVNHPLVGRQEIGQPQAEPR